MDDISNAVKYAAAPLLHFKLQKYQNEMPHVFDFIEWHERNATPQDYYMPPELRDQCKVANINFTKERCERISCFPYLPHGRTCQPKDRAVYIQSGNHISMSTGLFSSQTGK